MLFFQMKLNTEDGESNLEDGKHGSLVSQIMQTKNLLEAEEKTQDETTATPIKVSFFKVF